MATCAQVLEIDRSEILALAERVERRELTEAEGPLLASLLRHLVDLTDELREKYASIRRLRRVAFGPSSERRPHVVNQLDESPSEHEASSISPPARPPRKGHGRTKADAFTSARRLAIAHPHLTAGASCPSHCGGRVYRLATPSSKIWITLSRRRSYSSQRNLEAALRVSFRFVGCNIGKPKDRS
jgi:hypothetical protein